MEGFCDNHAFEMAEDSCRECGRVFCADCLVYSFGPKKPPFCLDCALGASGVRKNAGRGRVTSKRELKRRERNRKKEAKAEKKALQQAPIPVTAAMDWVSIDDSADTAPVARPIDDDGLPPIVTPSAVDRADADFDAKLQRTTR